MIFSLPSPIPRTVKDKEDLHSAFSRFAIIPYYGTSEGSSQHFLDLLTTLTELSPTFQATRADLAEYTFGTNFDVVTRAIPGLVQDETQPLDFQQKVAYVESLNNIGVTLPRISKTFRALDSHLDICGNAYLHLKRIEVGGTVRYYMRPLHYKHCAYLKSRDDGREFIIHSRFLTELNKMLKHPPTILPATRPRQRDTMGGHGAGHRGSYHPPEAGQRERRKQLLCPAPDIVGADLAVH